MKARTGSWSRRRHRLTPPEGFTTEQLALGHRVYSGLAASGNCMGCHGYDGRGTMVGPDLTDATWLWSDGGLEGIRLENIRVELAGEDVRDHVVADDVKDIEISNFRVEGTDSPRIRKLNTP